MKAPIKTPIKTPTNTPVATLYCACCGRPFIRTSTRGPAPRYCSQDCRLQMAVRRRTWTAREGAGRDSFGRPPAATGGRRTFAPWT